MKANALIDSLLMELQASCGFKTSSDFDRYQKAAVKIRELISETPSMITTQQVSVLMQCLSDNECGGHGLTQDVLQALYACDQRTFGEVFALEYFSIRGSAPIHTEDLVVALEVEETRRSFERALRTLSQEVKAEIEKDVAEIANRWPLNIRLSP
jgi:hypothetical protein